MEPSKANAKDAPLPPENEDGARLHIHDIKEMPSGQDEELAIIFREMRRASELSEEEVAARLGTPVETLQALESGAILALPEWNETTRIVTDYTAMLSLDSRPVLRRIKAQLAALDEAARPEQAQPVQVKQTEQLSASPEAEPRGGAEEVPAPAPPPDADKPPSGAPVPAAAAAPAATPAPAAGPAPVPPKPAARTEGPAGPPLPPGAAPPPRPGRAPDAPQPGTPASPPPPAAAVAAIPRPAKAKPPRRRLSIRAGTVVSWLLLLILFAAMGMGVRYAVEHPQIVWSTVDRLPDPAPRILRSVWELVRPAESSGPKPATPDPTIQKSDRLPEDKPPQGN